MTDYLNYGKLKNNIFKFNELKYKTSKHERQWNAYIRLVKLNNLDDKINYNKWQLSNENEKVIELTKEWYTNNKLGEKDENIFAQFWSETGIVGNDILRYAPSYFRLKNVNKKNQTNPFQTAFIFARNKYKKKMETTGANNKNINSNNINSNNINSNNINNKNINNNNVNNKNINNKYFPMLVGEYKENKTKLKYPIYVQPKLDGVRCVAFNDGGKVTMYSRTLKIWDRHNHIRESIFPILKKYKSIYLDGELYIHGKHFQDIVSIVKNPKKEDNKVQYHIFDLFTSTSKNKDAPFKKRYEILKKLYNDIKNKNIIKLVPLYKIENKKNLFIKLDEVLDQKYEGLIIRDMDQKYLTSNISSHSNIRSKKTIKLKKKITDEYEIVDFMEGKNGKSKGNIIWICQHNNIKFKVTYKGLSFDKQKEIYLDALSNFSSKYEGKMLTIEFDTLSKDGIPLKAKAIAIRDYE